MEQEKKFRFNKGNSFQILVDLLHNIIEERRKIIKNQHWVD